LAVLLLPLCAFPDVSSLKDISWPEIPKEAGGDPLVLQLAISSTQLAYGRRFDFYVRFVNRGDADLEITLPDDFINEHEVMKSDLENNNLAFPATWHPATAIMPPRTMFIIKNPNQDAWIGKYTKMVSYKDPKSKKEIKSNVIKYVCEEKSFSDEEVVTCQRELAEAIRLLPEESPSSFAELSTTHCGRAILSIGIKCIPHSLPVLKNHLEHNPDPKVRYVICQALLFLASKDNAQEIGFIPDFSSVNLIIDRLADEKNAKILVLNLMTSSWYIHANVLTSDQKQRLLDKYMALLDATDMDLRMNAAYALINNFPDRYDMIEERVARKDFYDENIAKDLLIRIKEIKGAKRKPK
jgi:hypothetical protein